MRAEPRAGQPCAPPAEPGTRAQHKTGAEHKVALNAPVRSMKMLELQLAAGATEVYLALASGAPVSWDALPANRDGEPTQVASRATLTALVSAAHDAGVLVHFCADAPVVPPDMSDEYRRHVDLGVTAGADTVVVGSLAACAWLAGSVPALVAGDAVGVSSVSLARHLRDQYGVRRVVLPHTLALAEIALFCTEPQLEVETPVQTGAGLDCGRCRLADTAGIGLGCRAGYRDTDGVDLGAFLDGASDCALCDVPALVELGVAALRLPGRESPNVRQNAKVTQMYRRALAGHAARVPITEVIAEIDRVELMWQMGWLPRLCDQQRCRFRDTPQLRAYV
ncbi:U32 family peptidase [Actinokineospora globicatena]|uniref:Protease n=1 Tax=Actinokineospora globicatena TaxID=103729 RepID=A0A9W6QIK1_9PSEU|nr:U32 family peptidase [Actinokineospora globicatena]GLW90132.1 hypothetical protein Aglo03_09480 [Actinokineospora globicatena]